MNGDTLFGDVQFSLSTLLRPWRRDPGCFALPISGKIRASVDTGEQAGAEDGAGEIELLLVLAAEAANLGVDLYDVCDAQSGGLEAVFCAVFDEEGEPKEDLMIEPLWQNLLCIMSITLAEKYQNTSIRVQAIDTAIATFGSRAIVVADQDDLGLNLDEWKQLGFKKIRGTTLAFRDTCCKNHYGLGLDKEE